MGRRHLASSVNAQMVDDSNDATLWPPKLSTMMWPQVRFTSKMSMLIDLIFVIGLIKRMKMNKKRLIFFNIYGG